ncbi:hypothetical protein DSCA_25170 [Desulfosarcina alkanivorans]|uniref:Uncharacterized protein n=1 Tax=Desulfosarcina alkanivorans TaxID=571177 RepID=A0A5K7YV84_9BACT|nr:tetratricopeptide repeat protein [Desulfosarcina alkanivorans]BBO68587.1 hypothetical protein DSCA_25170 [Desulfosarcina alkanivorans]
MRIEKIILGFKIIAGLITNPTASYFSVVEKVCLKELNKKPDNRFIKLFLSSQYLDHNQLDESKKLLESLLDHESNNYSTILLLSRVYFKSKQYKEVVDLLGCYEKLRESDSHNYYLGYSFIELREFESAINYLEKYVKHYPKDYIGFVRLGYAYNMIKKYDLSLKAYKKAEALNPNEQNIKNSIELCLKKLKKDQTLQ